MKKLLIITVVTVAGCLLIGHTMHIIRASTEFGNTVTALESEVNEYYTTTSVKAAEKTLELARPYMDLKDQGRFEQRLETLKEPWGMSHDSSYGFIWAIMENMEKWAVRQLNAKGEVVISREMTRAALIQEPAYLEILQLMEALEKMENFSDNLRYADNDRPKSNKEFEVARARFSEQKKVIEALLTK
ncbi:MAG: hypothetical protein Q7S16_04875 [bacterium]|nr:hypothetical protein [bacterium]